MASYEFMIRSLSGQQRATIYSDGTLEIPGFDAEYEELSMELGSDPTPAYVMYAIWDRIFESVSINVNKDNDIFWQFFSEFPEFFEQEDIVRMGLNYTYAVYISNIFDAILFMLRDYLYSLNEERCLAIASFIKLIRGVLGWTLYIDTYENDFRDVNQYTVEAVEDHVLVSGSGFEVFGPWRKCFRSEIADIFYFDIKEYPVECNPLYQINYSQDQINLIKKVLSTIGITDHEASPYRGGLRPPKPVKLGECGYHALLYLRKKPVEDIPYSVKYYGALIQYLYRDEMEHAFELATLIDANNNNCYDIIKMRRFSDDQLACQDWQDVMDKTRHSTDDFLDIVHQFWEEVE